MNDLNKKIQKLCINPDGTFTPYGIDLVNLFSNQLDRLAFILNVDKKILQNYVVNSPSPANFESVRNELDIILCPVTYGNDYFFATNQLRAQISKDFIIRNAVIPSLSDWCAKIIKRLPKSYTPIIIDRDMHTAIKNKILKEIKQLKNFIWKEDDFLIAIINEKRIQIPTDINIQICVKDHNLSYQDMVSFLEDCVNELNNYIASYYKNNNTTIGDLMIVLNQAAISLAADIYYGQVDKANKPYIFHCLRVMMSLDNPTKEEQIAAILHDVIEDSGYTFDMLRLDGYSDEVIDILYHLTKQDKETYDKYIERIKNNISAVKIKLSDLKDNMDLTRLDVITKKDKIRNEKYRKAFFNLKTYLIEYNKRENNDVN